MRKIRREFEYTEINAMSSDGKSKLICEKREGKYTVEDVAVELIKKHGYSANPYIIEVNHVKKVFVMTVDDFMKHGTEIQEPETIQVMNLHKEGVIL